MNAKHCMVAAALVLASTPALAHEFLDGLLGQAQKAEGERAVLVEGSRGRSVGDEQGRRDGPHFAGPGSHAIMGVAWLHLEPL